MKRILIFSAFLILFVRTANAQIEQAPRTMNAEYYLSLPANQQAWEMGLHKNMDFMCKPTYSLLRGHLAHFNPAEGAPTTIVRMSDNILRREQNISVAISNEGNFELRVQLTQPLWVYCALLGDIYIEPGDTLEIYGDMEHASDEGIQDIAYCSKGESGMINALHNTMMSRLGIDKYNNYDAISDAIKSGKNSVMAERNRIVKQIQEVCTPSFIHSKLDGTPLSPHAKEIMAISARAKLIVQLEDLFDGYKNYQAEKAKSEDAKSSKYQAIDGKEYYASLRPIANMLYDCPLMLCASTDWVYFNRVEFNPLFFDYVYTNPTDGFLSTTDKIAAKDSYNMEHYGIGRCFMSQMTMARALSEDMQELRERSNPDMNRWGRHSPMAVELENITKRMANVLPTITYPEISIRLMEAYRETIREIEISAKKGFELSGEHRAILNHIIAPYKGNVLYIDFWGMSCGPCRAGMLRQRTMVEELKGQPVRFLYVCDEGESPRDKAEKWMKQNNIYGEHVYVSHNEWNALMQMFNFSAIPHAVLIGKDGNVIQNNIFLRNKEQLMQYAE